MTFIARADEALTGSGKKPFRLVWWLVAAWVLNMIVFSFAADKMAPNSAALLLTKELRDNCAAKADVGWVGCDIGAMKEYPKFYRPLYALDVLVPIMDLQQARLWQPISGDGGRGTFAFFWRCFAGAFGWLLGVGLGSLALRYVGEPKQWSQAWGLSG